MTYKKLSEQVDQLANPQRSDRFVAAFLEQVRTGQIKAIFLPRERFTLPKQYTRRKDGSTYQRTTRELLFEPTEAFDTWFEDINRTLSVSRANSQIKVTEQNLNAGLLDFGALAEETRERLEQSFKRGQKLGGSRKRPQAARTTTPAAATNKKSTSKKSATPTPRRTRASRKA